jgi:KaiC/GvpD/RAD55 family RecA-like ATPase
MVVEDLAGNSPLRILKGEQPEFRMGLVMARAGLGKTAILVQIALDSMLQDMKVLHVNIGESLEKTKAWYDDIYDYLTTGNKVSNAAEAKDSVMRNRMIMTFKEDAFSRARLEERLNDLVYQNIFRPDCLVIDGLDFASTEREALQDLSELAKAMNVQAWFTALTHRDDDRVSDNGVPSPCHEMDDLFHTVIVLQPEEGAIKLNIVKDSIGNAAGTNLNLDPATMMVQG